MAFHSRLAAALLLSMSCTEDYEAELSSYEDSALPVLVIATQGKAIPDEPKMAAQLFVFEPELTRLSELRHGQPSEQFAMGIERRGHSSQRFPKRQYGIELRDERGADAEVELLTMPAEADWVLQAPFTDKSLVRNHFAYALSRSAGRWAPRTVFAELFLTQGERANLDLEHYRGVYVVTERIKRGPQRVDLPKCGDDPEAEPSFLLEWTQAFRLGSQDRWFRTRDGAALQVDYPKADKLTDRQEAWITEHIQAFERALTAADDSALAYMDVPSFVDFFLMNELLRNHDVFTSSTFLSVDYDRQIAMGPVWDFDRALGDVEFDRNWRTEGFLLPTRGWGKALLKKRAFVAAYRSRWHELRQGAFANDAMLGLIDDAVAALADAPARNFEKWRVLGRYVKANRAPYAKSHAEEIDKMKAWLRERAAWIDAHIDEL